MTNNLPPAHLFKRRLSPVDLRVLDSYNKALSADEINELTNGELRPDDIAYYIARRESMRRAKFTTAKQCGALPEPSLEIQRIRNQQTLYNRKHRS